MSTLEQSIAIATRAIAQLDAGNSSECDAILSGHGQQIARDFLNLAPARDELLRDALEYLVPYCKRMPEIIRLASKSAETAQLAMWIEDGVAMAEKALASCGEGTKA